MSPRGSVIPMRGHAPPELAPPGDDAARHARVRRRSASSLVVRGRAVASLTTRRKVSRSRGDCTIGKDTQGNIYRRRSRRALRADQYFRSVHAGGRGIMPRPILAAVSATSANFASCCERGDRSPPDDERACRATADASGPGGIVARPREFRGAAAGSP